MAYKLKFSEQDVLGKGKFKNAKGRTECVEFVRQATDAPQTTLWNRGKKVWEGAYHLAIGASGVRRDMGRLRLSGHDSNAGKAS